MMQLLVGQMLYGFCNGYFGSDSYSDKRVEAVGADWVVARNEDGEIEIARGVHVHEKLYKFTTHPSSPLYIKEKPND